MKKKTKAIIIQIPEPCSQDFSKMHQLPGGRYCGQCERTVVDFREMSDQEIVRIYTQREGRVCGIFKGHQLSRPLALPQPRQESKKWVALAALSSTLLLSNPANGQTVTDNKASFIANQSKESEHQNPDILENMVTIDGWVFGDNDEPIPFASILLANGNGTATDFDGYFKIETPIRLIGTEIKVSSMGYEPKSVIIHPENTNNNPIEVVLKFGLTMEPVVVVHRRSRIERDYTGGGGNARIIFESNHSDGIQITVDKGMKITTFPNPFVSYLNIELEPPKAQTYLFHLYNESGQLVFAEARALEAGLQTFQFSLAQRQLPAGEYYLRISDDNGEIRTKKLIKTNP